MPDERSLRQKLEAMANQTASPNEAEIAREALARLDANRPPAETPGVLTREQILGSPESGTPARSVRFYSATLGSWVTIDADDFAIEVDDQRVFPYRRG